MNYITFFTAGYYEGVYKEFLKPSSEAVGLDVKASREHNYRDWGMNTRIKARSILRALNEGKDIVWLDADTTIKKYPILLENIPEEFDVAVYYLDWSRHWEGIKGGDRRELVNSVMMIRNRPHIYSLINEWIDRNYMTTVWEQQVFQNLLEQRKDIKVFSLPDEYCTILDRNGNIPDYVQDPVIVQNQISRKIRNDRTLLEK